jgi:hypothetical protein
MRTMFSLVFLVAFRPHRILPTLRLQVNAVQAGAIFVNDTIDAFIA